MIEKVICEKCGTEMIPVDPERPVGMKCPKCGWGWVTSYVDPIQEDESVYEISLEANNIITKDNIKLISEVVNVNYLEAKRVIESSPCIIMSGRAVSVKDAIERFKAADIKFTVCPEFPYL